MRRQRRPRAFGGTWRRRVRAFARQIVNWKWSRVQTCGQASRRRGQSRRPTAGIMSQCDVEWNDQKASKRLQTRDASERVGTCRALAMVSASHELQPCAASGSTSEVNGAAAPRPWRHEEGFQSRQRRPRQMRKSACRCCVNRIKRSWLSIGGRRVRTSTRSKRVVCVARNAFLVAHEHNGHERSGFSHALAHDPPPSAAPK